jgi:hypothetical protein
VDNASVNVIPSGTTIHIDNKPIEMKNNIVNINNFKLYTNKKDNPFTISGNINATNLDRPTVNLKMSTNNLQLINSKKTPQSLAYGRLDANFNSTWTGPLQSLKMRGNARILGNSNFSYVMLESPMEVQDGFKDMVTFTYFADTLPRQTRRPIHFPNRARQMAEITGVDVVMSISIDPVVRFKIDMDEDQTNYVQLRGGGDLTLYYSAQGDMTLSGRYTISGGTMRYSIPVIPLTDFNIRNGSYVDWSGDPMNPYLNITAFSKVRSTVTLDNQSTMVDFNAGIQIRDYLDKMTIEFILEAPNNANVQSQLTAMGEEERSKQAISLLVTGVYLASNGTGKDNMNVGAALNTFLQREIKSMLGSMMGDVPFSFDIIYYDGTDGTGTRVDYLGRFSKSFFNERFSATLGLRYATNTQVKRADSIILSNKILLDDISTEYRLDTDGSRAVSLFRTKEYENMFEGDITKLGASFIIRKKVKRFTDLFNFRKQAVLLPKNEEEEDVSGENTPESNETKKKEE